MAFADLETRTPEQWYREAERTYSVNHQGCPWCGGSYRVYCQRRGPMRLFYCQACDFQVTYDSLADRFSVRPGFDDVDASAPDTMFDTPSLRL
jgi:hypothetical protein